MPTVTVCFCCSLDCWDVSTRCRSTCLSAPDIRSQSGHAGRTRPGISPDPALRHPAAMEWWDRGPQDRLAEWNVAKEFFLSVAHSPLGLGQRLRCYGLVARWVLKYHRRIAKDLFIASFKTGRMPPKRPQRYSPSISTPVEGNPYESRNSRRRSWLAPWGRDRTQAKTDGRDWRKTDSLAHLDALRALRTRRLRRSRWGTRAKSSRSTCWTTAH